MSLQHILFDFDGTLIDSSAAILDTWAAVLVEKNIAAIRPLSRDLIGPPLQVTLQALTGSTDTVLLAELAQAFRQRYDSVGIAVTQAYPGIDLLLKRLQDAGFTLHVATNKRELPTQLLLEKFGWTAAFNSVFCLDSREPPFPNKGHMLRTLLLEKQIAVQSALYIGDTSHDEEAAQQAGLPFVAVGWGYGLGAQQVSATALSYASAAALADYLLASGQQL